MCVLGFSTAVIMDLFHVVNFRPRYSEAARWFPSLASRLSRCCFCWLSSGAASWNCIGRRASSAPIKWQILGRNVHVSEVSHRAVLSRTGVCAHHPKWRPRILVERRATRNLFPDGSQLPVCRPSTKQDSFAWPWTCRLSLHCRNSRAKKRGSSQSPTERRRSRSLQLGSGACKGLGFVILR